MPNILLNMLHTEITRIRRQKNVFLVEQISCVGPVSKKKPEEKLRLVLSFRNPHPLKDV
jgi:hypothetical protein